MTDKQSALERMRFFASAYKQLSEERMFQSRALIESQYLENVEPDKILALLDLVELYHGAAGAFREVYGQDLARIETKEAEILARLAGSK